MAVATSWTITLVYGLSAITTKLKGMAWDMDNGQKTGNERQALLQVSRR
jgi:hypothetical protein